MNYSRLTFKYAVFSLLFTCFFYNQLQAADSLKYIAHAFVKIKTNNGMVIYIDPAQVNAFEDSADVVLITHEHGDHTELNRIKRKSGCVIVRAANALKSGVYQSFTFDNITVKAVPAYNSNHPKASSVGYIIAIPASNGDTIKIYHAGDTGKITEMADLANQNVTYALLPMDGTYTMTPQVAAEAADLIKARYDIPIHTMPGTPGYSDARVALFTSLNKLVLKPGTIIDLSNPVTAVEEGSNLIIESFELFQNFPNPFNPSTVISYQLPASLNPSQGRTFPKGMDSQIPVNLKVYDLLGKEVATLVNGEKAPGYYEVRFDGSNLSTGVYFYRLTAGNFTSTKKLLLMK